MRAYWRHLANTIKLVLPSANPTPQPKRKIDRFSHFCAGHGCRWADWRHLVNTIELVHPSAYSSPQRKRQIDRCSRFAQLTAENAYTLQWLPIHQNYPSHVGSGPSSNMIPWAQIWAHNPNGSSIGSVVVAQMTAEWPCTQQWFARFPSKLPISMGDLDPM